MRGAPGRLVLFGVALFICLVLIGVSATGILGPVEGLIAIPLGFIQGLSSGATNNVSKTVNTISDVQTLQQRNAELEQALVNLSQEVVQLREIKSDYPRLSSLLQYKSGFDDWQVTAANVIGHDTTGVLRTITIDRGTRDNVSVGQPVVVALGLVGRVSKVTATSALVTLVTDTNSYVNARLQSSRGEGSITGTASGDLQMTYIALADQIKDGDSVVTSGVGGKFPRGILIGQVTSSRQDDSKLFQQAQVRSLVDFNRLEIVLVITSFTPVDLSAFITPTPAPGAAQ